MTIYNGNNLLGGWLIICRTVSRYTPECCLNDISLFYYNNFHFNNETVNYSFLETGIERYKYIIILINLQD